MAERCSCNCLSVLATSPFTRKIFNHYNFQVLRFIDSGNFVEDFKNGRCPIFPGVDTSIHVKFTK